MKSANEAKANLEEELTQFGYKVAIHDFSETQAKGGAKSKRGSKADSERSTRPWEATGISRA